MCQFHSAIRQNLSRTCPPLDTKFAMKMMFDFQRGNSRGILNDESKCKNASPPMSKSLPSFVLPLYIESENEKKYFANSLD